MSRPLTPTRVWVVDDDESIRWVLERALLKYSMDVRCFADAESALDALQHCRQLPQVILSDIRMPGLDGLQFLHSLQRDGGNVPVIIMTAHTDLDSTVAAYEGGAFDYLPKPFDIEAAVEMVNRARQAFEASDQREPPVRVAARATGIVGGAAAMQPVFRAIGRLSRSSITVLINGESGTGKELIAHALHRHSPRCDAPFIALNMSAIPRDLMESELFGHERGAFTGAQAQRQGRFEQAHGGTLFLDEIGDMPAELQTRLLRVLAEGSFFRVGGARAIDVDVRIIAATHQDLEARVAAGDFREDLFHRLNVIRIQVPPLRDRPEDIPELLGHFMAEAAAKLEVAPKSIAEAALARLCMHRWPGNVRELQNIAHRLMVMATGRRVELSDLPEQLGSAQGAPEGAAAGAPAAGDWRASLSHWLAQSLAAGESGAVQGVVAETEALLICAAMQHCRNHRQRAARALGWGRNTLSRKIKELGLSFD